MSYVVVVKNMLTNEIFEKEFESLEKRNIFKTKCRYSKRLRCIGDYQKDGN